MLRPWQRIAGCTAAAAVALLLGGCEVHGTVDVKSGSEVQANLVFTDAEVDCLGLTRYAGLVIKGTPESDGDQTCRAQGTIELESLKDFGIQLTQVGEYLTLDLALPERFGYLPTDVDITFPGTILDSGALTVLGNTVQLRDGEGVTGASVARVVALSHPGPEWWVMALSGGLIGGVALTLTVLLLMRRRRGPSATPHAEEEQPASAETTTAASQGPSPDPATVTATARPEPVRDPDYEALFAPPSPGTGAAAARPSSQPSPPPVAPVATDHGIWAPPEDRGDR